MSEIQMIEPVLRERYFPGLASLGLLRLDLPDPIAGGNKSYKLKYHLEAFRNSGAKSIVTFGGAFSNHISAVAYTGMKQSIPVIGIIRGNELNPKSNAVLESAGAMGMQLKFVTREEYRERYSDDYHEKLRREFPGCYVLPEGGGGEPGVRGCMEILNGGTDAFDDIVLPVGTGTTCEGIRRTLKPHQTVHGIDVVSRHAEHSLGGYAEYGIPLLDFASALEKEMNLPLDHVYSGKALFAIHNMTKAGLLKKRNVLFVHTGGYAHSRWHL